MYIYVMWHIFYAYTSCIGSLTVPKEESIAQQLVSPRAVYKNHDPHDLVSLAKEVKKNKRTNE